MFSLLRISLFSACIYTCTAISNFFTFNSPTAAWSNEAWGRYTMSLDEYAPTCGWKLIVSSSYPLTSIDAWDSTNSRFDDRTYLITNLNYNENLITSTQHRSGSITLRGNWGNTAPNVFITWYCVCTNAPSGCVQVPYTTVSPFDATPAPATTSSNYVTTDTPNDDTTQSLIGAVVAATAAQPAAAATAAPPGAAATADPSGSSSLLYVGYNVVGPTKIFLQKQEGLCYAGATYTRHVLTRHVMDCCVMCKDTQSCAAVNYWVNAFACDLVLENTDSNPGLLTSVYPGCHYWKVVWKA